MAVCRHCVKRRVAYDSRTFYDGLTNVCCTQKTNYPEATIKADVEQTRLIKEGLQR
jgi:hypothetical protein